MVVGNKPANESAGGKKAINNKSTHGRTTRMLVCLLACLLAEKGPFVNHGASSDSLMTGIFHVQPPLFREVWPSLHQKWCRAIELVLVVSLV